MNYVFGQGGGVTNWFDQDDFKPGYFSIRDTMGALQAHPEAGALVGRLMAAATVVVIPMIILFIAFRKNIVTGVSRGGLKG